jgi:transposase-like protein
MNKIAVKDSGLKAAQKRLQVLQLAEKLGNITAACEKAGMDRTSFYEWRRRYQQLGIDGLKDLPRVHKSHPQTTPEATYKKIIEYAFRYPLRGCTFISEELKSKNMNVSSPTVQKILIKNGLGSQEKRIEQLKDLATKKKIKLEPEQLDSILKIDPKFKLK